jgi:hypothetical protein
VDVSSPSGVQTVIAVRSQIIDARPAFSHYLR